MRILIPLLLVSSTLLPQDSGFKGDVNGIRVIRHVDKHPESWRLWQPFIAQWKRRQLVVAFGAMANGKKDMGSILASVSTNDGDSWEEPVAIFDHRIRQGAQQYGYANPVLFRPPGQEVIWCFAMRCPLNYTNSEDSHLTAAYTADGGRTWTQVELAMDYGGPLILNAGIEPVVVNGQQRYLLPAHRNTLQKDERGSRDHFVLSSSSLLEWRLESYIPQPSTGNKVFLHEGNIAPGDTAGELKIMMRTAGTRMHPKRPIRPARIRALARTAAAPGARRKPNPTFITPSRRATTAGRRTARMCMSTATAQPSRPRGPARRCATR